MMENKGKKVNRGKDKNIFKKQITDHKKQGEKHLNYQLYLFVLLHPAILYIY